MNNIIIYVVVGENHTIQTINLGQINKEAIKVNMLLLCLCLNWFQLFSYIDYVSLWIVSATPLFLEQDTLTHTHNSFCVSLCFFPFTSAPKYNGLHFALLFFFSTDIQKTLNIYIYSSSYDQTPPFDSFIS